ncbi:class I SAM-dependent methyltransferase [Patulibacter defluvii]|uniref:class I SAM-dependent methyltransferase n=1 Tax=Patulibacter defluvii TaxID=3095358 RepID=UPI002A74A7D3|nr:methyltransferase domain-containing protein [Patulibacter sp. DM4]
MSALQRARDLAGYDEVAGLRQSQDLDWVLSLAPAAPGSLADLGCGTGALLQAAHGRWPSLGRTLGIDGAATRVAEARARLGARAEIRQGDLLALDPLGERFDLITATSVLHWLHPDEERALAWIAAHLADDGALLLTTHHPHVGPDGLGAEDVVAREAYAALGIDDFGAVLPMAVRARPAADVQRLLAAVFALDAIEEREVAVETASAEQYARFHASTFGTYFSRRVPAAEEEAFFAAVGEAAAARQARDGLVYPISVRLWRARPRRAAR